MSVVTHPLLLYLAATYAEIAIRVLRNTGEGRNVDQDNRSCEISDEQRKQYSYTMKAVEETQVAQYRES